MGTSLNLLEAKNEGCYEFSKRIFKECLILQSKQGKSEGFDSCDWPSNLKLEDSNRQFFHPCDHEIWWITSKYNRALLLYYVKLCASFQIHWWIQTGFTAQKRSIRVEIDDILSRVTSLKIWWMTLENNRAPLLYYTKLCASFQSHRWSQTWVTIRKRSSRVKICDFLSCVTLKFDGWPWKTIGHIFYTTLSFLHHFKAMGEFKLELQSGNAKFRSKSAIFSPVWPWNLTPLLCFFKLCASFRTHWWIPTGVTVWKRPIWIKFDDF